jgi:hypothetical protein
VECGGPSFANFSARGDSWARKKASLHSILSLFSAWQVAEKYEPMIQAKLSEAEKEIKKKIG